VLRKASHSARIRQVTHRAQVPTGAAVGKQQHKSKSEDQDPERDHPGQQGAIRAEGIRGRGPLSAREPAHPDRFGRRSEGQLWQVWVRTGKDCRVIGS
jgi:hypothetical protein